MNCVEFERRWHDLLDQRRGWDDEPATRQHVAGCQACRRRVAVFEQLLDGLTLGETPPLDASFASRVVSRATSDQPLASPVARGSWRQFAMAVATVAALLLLVAWPAWRARDAARRPAPHSAGGAGLAALDRGAAPAPKPHDTLAAALTPDNGERSPAAAPSFPPGGFPQPLEPSWRTFDANYWALVAELPSTLSHAGVELATGQSAMGVERVPGVRPLASSLSTAWSTLWQSFPGGRDADETTPQALWRESSSDLVG